MKILALDTATEVCTAALSIDGEVQERYRLAPRLHSELILAMLDDLLKEADISLQQLDCLAFGRGPGSFIGLRIAAGVTQGVAYAADLPVVPVSTLAAMAQGVTDAAQTSVLAAIDARMQEVYWGAYQRDANGMMHLTGTESVSATRDVALPSDSQPAHWYGVGTGWREDGPHLSAQLTGVAGFESEFFPSARHVADLGRAGFERGEAVSAELAQPVYLRDQVAKKQGRIPGSGHI